MDGVDLVQMRAAAKDHQLDQVCSKRKRGGAQFLHLADNPVHNCGERHGLAIVRFRFFQLDI